MQEIVHDTFTITRDYGVSPERLFQAFADPEQKRRWFAEGEGYKVDSYQLDFRVGGSETSAFRVETPEFTSEEIRNDTYFLDIVPDRRIVTAYTMSNVGVPFSASLQSVTLTPTEGGTRLTLVEQVTFMEGSDGTELRREGTELLLASLARELGEEVPA